MRADMMLVDEYSKSGWEIGKEFYWKGGSNKVEIDMLNLEKGILGEVKSDVPGGGSLKKWLSSKKFKESFIKPRIEALEHEGHLSKIDKFVLCLPERAIGEMSMEEIEGLVKSALMEYGADWEVEIITFEW